MSLSDTGPGSERLIGRYGNAGHGQTMIVVASIHGNEPSGLKATERILASLQAHRPPMHGAWIALRGNIAALQAGERFLTKDLNRVWTEERVRDLDDATESPLNPEDREQLQLFRALTMAVNGGGSGTIFFDLHTSSADGAPFVTIGDTLRNRRLAMQFDLPIILGLEEQVDGALLEFMNNRGYTTIGVEAGQHDAASSIDHHESMLWVGMHVAGLLRESDIPDYDMHCRRLRAVSERTPPVIEVRHRHAIRENDNFRMDPGFQNFQPIEKGQRLAEDRNGPIHAVESGVLLLPLYQGLGDDGFFIAREVRRSWLKVSEWMRSLRLDKYVPLLPGVRVAGPGGMISIDTRVARYWPLEVFHLLGYRKLRQKGRVLYVSRRRFDQENPLGW